MRARRRGAGDAAMATLRHLLLPVVELARQRVNRFKQRNQIPFPDLTPKQLASSVQHNTSLMAGWPPEVLEEMCQDAIKGFAFPGEIITHEKEPVSTHGLVVIVRGMVGVMRAGVDVPSSLVAEVMGLDPSARDGKQHAVPIRTAHAPAVLGETQCLTDGINSNAVRALSLTDYVIINIARIRTVINSRLSPALLNATFTKEMRMARKSTLRQFFRQTPPLMLLSWICHDMTPDEVGRLIHQLTPEVAVPGQDIVAQGAAASTMYFLRRGTACIVVGGNVIPGVVLGPGKSFGEMGLLFHERRMATVRATTMCDLWVLSERALLSVFSRAMVERKIIGKATEIRTRMISSVSRASLKPAVLSYVPFAELPPEGLAEILAALQPRVYPTGRVLLSAGHTSDCMFFIHSGVASTVDSAAVRFEKGSALAVHGLVRHRELVTITAVGVADTFVLSLTDARAIMKKYGLLQRALAYSGEALRLEAHFRGVDFRDIVESSPSPSRPNSAAVKVTTAPNAVDDTKPAPSPPRMMSAGARRHIRLHPYEQPCKELQRPASAVHAAKVVADEACQHWRQTTFALRAESFQCPVEPVLGANQAAVQRTAQKLWFDENTKNIFRTEQFAAEVAHMPSAYHASVTVMSMRARSSRRLTLNSTRVDDRTLAPQYVHQPTEAFDDFSDVLHLAERLVRLEKEANMSMPMIPVVSDDDSSSSLEFAPPKIFGAINLFAAAEALAPIVKRPQYTPINPHSYAAVLPISMQPLAPHEQPRRRTVVFKNGVSRGMRLSASVFNAAELLHGAEHAEDASVDRRPSPPQDLDQLAMELAHKVLTLEERQDVATLGDEVLDDVDYLEEAWQSALRHPIPMPIVPGPTRSPQRPKTARPAPLSPVAAAGSLSPPALTITTPQRSMSVLVVADSLVTPPPEQGGAKATPPATSRKSAGRAARPSSAASPKSRLVDAETKPTPAPPPPPRPLRVRYCVRPSSAPTVPRPPAALASPSAAPQRR